MFRLVAERLESETLLLQLVSERRRAYKIAPYRLCQLKLCQDQDLQPEEIPTLNESGQGLQFDNGVQERQSEEQDHLRADQEGHPVDLRL